MKELDTDHIEAILEGKWGSDWYRDMFKEELRFRANELAAIEADKS